MQKYRDNPPAQGRKKSISMHEDVPVWADCCSCEAEPYWQELTDEKPKKKDKPDGTEERQKQR